MILLTKLALKTIIIVGEVLFYTYVKLSSCHSATMATLSVQDKIEIVLIHGDNYSTCRETAEIFNTRHPEKNINYSTVAKILRSFKQSGSVQSKYQVTHRRNVTGNEDNELDIVLSVVENPKMPLSQRQTELNVSDRSIRRVFKRHKFKPYKPQKIHTLKERDLDARLDFAFWFQGGIEDDGNFSQKILYSDESIFTSNGTVSSQNCRWWADENPHFKIECRDQYYFKTNVWCGILNQEIVGPVFFRQTLNSDRYLNMLQTSLMDYLENLSLEVRANMFFQQDGASVHSTLPVRRWLDRVFPNAWIGRYSANPWPARSPDLTPMDFFLWGYLKEKVYIERPFRNIAHLEETITNCIRSVTPQMLRNVHSEMHRRTMRCIENDGGHVE